VTRTFDLSSSDYLVPLAVLRGLAEHAKSLGREWVLVGAAARDLVIHSPLSNNPVRATNDVDIAVGISNESDFDAFTHGFEPRRGGRHAFMHMGVELDIVPFGLIEEDGWVLFSDGHRLDVVGLQEAAETPDIVILEPDLHIPVAPAELQVVLKLLAWRDRHQDTGKDASDLREILAAASEGVYAEEAWEDAAALEACDYMIDRAGAYHLGRIAAERFTLERSQRIIDFFKTSELDLLRGQLGGPTATEQLDAYRLGFERGRHLTGS